MGFKNINRILGGPKNIIIGEISVTVLAGFEEDPSLAGSGQGRNIRSDNVETVN